MDRLGPSGNLPHVAGNEAYEKKHDGDDSFWYNAHGNFSSVGILEAVVFVEERQGAIGDSHREKW